MPFFLFLIPFVFITEDQSQCSNCRPKVGPGNDYMSFHGQADEIKSRLPAGYLILALDWIFLYFSKCDILNLQWLEANFLNWGVNMVKLLGKIKVGPLTAAIEYDFSCRLLRLPLFPSSSGYNTVVRIPAGATNIDIKQVSYSGKPEDDNYLGECALHMCVRAVVRFPTAPYRIAWFSSEARSDMEAVQPNKYLLHPLSFCLTGQCHYPLT